MMLDFLASVASVELARITVLDVVLGVVGYKVGLHAARRWAERFTSPDTYSIKVHRIEDMRGPSGTRWSVRRWNGRRWEEVGSGLCRTVSEAYQSAHEAARLHSRQREAQEATG